MKSATKLERIFVFHCIFLPIFRSSLATPYFEQVLPTSQKIVLFCERFPLRVFLLFRKIRANFFLLLWSESGTQQKLFRKKCSDELSILDFFLSLFWLFLFGVGFPLLNILNTFSGSVKVWLDWNVYIINPVDKNQFNFS